MSWLTDLMNAIKALPRLERQMGAVSEALAGVSDQLGKAQGEIVGKLDELQRRLADAGKLDHEDQAAIQAVRDAAQRLDDVVPDPVPEAPVEEPAPVDSAPAEPVEPEFPAPQEPTA